MAKQDRRNHYGREERLRTEAAEKTREALHRQNLLFPQTHKEADEQQLLQYVKDFAEELGQSPDACEVIGGSYIAQRFGGWEKVLEAAGLSGPGEIPCPEKRLIYKKEFKRQLKALRQQQQTQKTQKQAERRQKDAAGRALVQEQQQRDALWGREHEEDTEEQLLAYVKQMAARLGHAPLSREVPGGTYIAKRIGSWALVLHLCDLPLPDGVERPNPKTLKAYLQRKSAENT